MAGVIEGFRWALTGHGQSPGLLLLASTAAVAIVFAGGIFFFQRMEGAIADRVYSMTQRLFREKGLGSVPAWASKVDPACGMRWNGSSSRRYRRSAERRMRPFGH